MNTEAIGRSKIGPFVLRLLSPALAILALLLALAPLAVSAAPPPTVAAGPEPQAAAPHNVSDPGDLEAFLDGLAASQLDAYHVPGLTISAVKDGKLLFAKGYGFADLENRRPVTADQTLFRVGSVSKLFVGTAVMQLVEEGKLDLDADVNGYLNEFQIPATFPQPITLEHLLTHTAGFEEQIRDSSDGGASDLRPLGTVLARSLPARVRPPGELAAYSNHGMTLAAYIVEQVSGIPFDRYVEERIFQPLEMDHSSFRQPLPAALAADVSQGFSYQGGDYRVDPFEYVQVYPAGSLSSTAADMAKFMIAHLQDGRYGNGRILQEATAREMHRRHFTHDPRLPGMALSFYEMYLNGQRLIGHGGDTILFHTLMALVPDSGVGLFFSSNAAGGALAGEKLLEAFMNRYFPAPPVPPAQPPAGFAGQAGQYAGSYWANRTSYTSIFKIAALLGAVNVSATPDGYLAVPRQGSEMKKWVQVEPMVFRQADGLEMMVFRADAQGGPAYLFSANTPFMAFLRVPWYDTLPFQGAVFGFSLLLFLSALVAGPAGFIFLRGVGKETRRLARVSRLLAWAAAFFYVVFVLGFVTLVSNPSQLVSGVPPILMGLLALALSASLLVVAEVALAAVAWRERFWGRAGRIHYSLVALAGVIFVAWLAHWNMLGFNLF